MEIKIFTDVIDALEKLGNLISKIKDFPKRERDKYITAATEAFTLLDSALVIVINWLGDLAHNENDNDFMKELSQLEETKGWMDIERDVRLCRNLRIAGADLKSLYWCFKNTLNGNDEKNMKDLVDQVLEQEYKLAEFISSAFSTLAGIANPSTPMENCEKARSAVDTVREKAKSERQRLIRSELRFLDSVIYA